MSRAKEFIDGVRLNESDSYADSWLNHYLKGHYTMDDLAAGIRRIGFTVGDAVKDLKDREKDSLKDSDDGSFAAYKDDELLTWGKVLSEIKKHRVSLVKHSKRMVSDVDSTIKKLEDGIKKLK
jgi:hypothetical protein